VNNGAARNRRAATRKSAPIPEKSITPRVRDADPAPPKRL
jgi:hypothetical protein